MSALIDALNGISRSISGPNYSNIITVLSCTVITVFFSVSSAFLAAYLTNRLHLINTIQNTKRAIISELSLIRNQLDSILKNNSIESEIKTSAIFGDFEICPIFKSTLGSVGYIDREYLDKIILAYNAIYKLRHESRYVSDQNGEKTLYTSRANIIDVSSEISEVLQLLKETGSTGKPERGTKNVR